MPYYTLPSTTVGAAFGRSTTLKVPNAFDPRKTYPLLVLLHNYGSTGAGLQTRLGLAGAPQMDDGVIIFAPNATLTDGGANTYWNYWNTAAGDFQFINDTVAEIKANWPVSWVAGLGYSNGGFMTIQLAIQYPSLFHAMFTHAAAAGVNDPVTPAAYTIPHFHYHGSIDATVLPAGDATGATLPGSLSGHGGVGSVGYTSTTVTVSQSNARNGGAGSLGAAGAAFDYVTDVGGSETTAQAYSGTTSQSAVELWTGTGANHGMTIASQKGGLILSKLRANHRTP